jgi:transcriptional regulator with XRE-family HTH domain
MASVGPNKRVGTLLRARREELDLSQRDIADAIDYDNHQFISHIERGASPLPRKYIAAWAEVLQLDPRVIVDAFCKDIEEELLEGLNLLEPPPPTTAFERRMKKIKDSAKANVRALPKKGGTGPSATLHQLPPSPSLVLSRLKKLQQVG